MPRAGHARLAIFDVAGRCVRSLLDARVDAGDRSVRWNGREAVDHVPAGLYFSVLTFEGRGSADAWSSSSKGVPFLTPAMNPRVPRDRRSGRGDACMDCARRDSVGSGVRQHHWRGPAVHGSFLVYPNGSPTRGVAIADLDEDGRNDLIAATDGGVSAQFRTRRRYLRPGDRAQRWLGVQPDRF